MNIQPHLLSDLKFIRLEKKLPRRALYILIRIWSHCQSVTRSGVWEDVDVRDVELVAQWRGKPGELAKILSETGWISVISPTPPGVESGHCLEGSGPNGAGAAPEPARMSIRIVGWEEANSNLILSWKHGKMGGRPSRNESAELSASATTLEQNPRVTRGLTQMEPTGNPRANLLNRIELNRKEVSTLGVIRTSWEPCSLGGAAHTLEGGLSSDGVMPEANSPHGVPPPPADPVPGRADSREDGEAPDASGQEDQLEEGTFRVPPVVVNEKLARKWFREFVAEGAKFEEADFKDVFGWLHGTRDIQTGRWKVGKSGLVTDPRPILENRLCDAMERRLNRAGQLTTGGMAQPSSPGSRAFVLRQQIAALEEQLENHKGNPDGGYAADVKHIHQEAWRVKARELDALKTQLTKINEQPG